MVDRISALEGHYKTGRFGADGEVGVTLTEVRDLCLHQAAAWPDTLTEVGKLAAAVVGVDVAPGPCSSATGDSGSLLRTEPLKWWVFGAQAPALADDLGAVLDLSHSRSHFRIAGPEAATLLKRLLPLDLRDGSFVVGDVASSSFHHISVTVWRTESGYELFVPRGFALAAWEGITETAAQFGAEIV